MLNIISLSATRDKVTWPGKVIKNLIKGLDVLWYPYVLNHDINATKRLLIHDDIFTMKLLGKVHPSTKVILWPNLYNMPRNIPKNIFANNHLYIYPSLWIQNMWKYFWYTWKSDVWPTGIDTDIFTPSQENKKYVLIYTKMRSDTDIQRIKKNLISQSIDFKIMRYGNYTEEDFIRILRKCKYVIWLGIAETQWIALQEILSCDIPVLIWDISKIWDWQVAQSNQVNLLNKEELDYSKWVTSAEYFDHTCGLKIKSKQEIKSSICYMEKNYNSFSPRKYILKNLSLEKQARDFIKLFEKHYWLSYKSWLKEKLLNKKKLRNNKMLNIVFKIYDSNSYNFWKKIYKKNKKISIKTYKW